MINYEKLLEYDKVYGSSFYLVDLQRFLNNFNNLLKEFRYYYQNTNIAYSFKTNYLPAVLNIVKCSGGYAEIVSGMELELARKVGFQDADIYYNGPCKEISDIESLLLSGGHVNLDGIYEVNIVKEIAKRNPDKNICVGIRCLGDIGQEHPSRFGFSLQNGEFEFALAELKGVENITIEGLHLHLPNRDISSFERRMRVVEEIANSFEKYEISLSYFSLGGGYMGIIPVSMQDKFGFEPPSYCDYAEVVAKRYNEISNRFKCLYDTELIIEPGSAVVSDAIQYVTKVVNIKKSADRVYATIKGSTFNINPQVKGMERPFDVYSHSNSVKKRYSNVYFVGYTCIESDYLAMGYTGEIGVGDYLVFNNIGSYSLTMKPPFIQYDSAYIDKNTGKELSRKQSFSDVFDRFEFD